MDAKEIIARRVAQEVKPNTLVNLGIGLPSLVAHYLPKDVHVFFQAENGVIGLGPRPPEGMEDPDLTDAGGGFVTAMPGAASIDSAMSFGLIRGGHLHMTVLGGLEVDERGYLANWMVPGKMVPGMGGAMDLVSGREEGRRGDGAYGEGRPQDRPALHPAAHRDPPREPHRHRNGGHRADRGRAVPCASAGRACPCARLRKPPARA